MYVMGWTRDQERERVIDGVGCHPPMIIRERERDVRGGECKDLVEISSNYCLNDDEDIVQGAFVVIIILYRLIPGWLFGWFASCGCLVLLGWMVVGGGDIQRERRREMHRMKE